MGKFGASGRGAGCRIMERRTGQGWREWAETMPDRDAELGTAAGSRLLISKRFGGHSGGVLYGLYDSPAWTHSPISSTSADPLQYRLRHGPDYEPAVVGSHVARNNRRPIHSHSTRRHDGDRPDLSRQTDG